MSYCLTCPYMYHTDPIVKIRKGLIIRSIINTKTNDKMTKRHKVFTENLYMYKLLTESNEPGIYFKERQ